MAVDAGTPGGVYDLERFTLSDMTRCGIQLRKLGAGASSLEAVAGRTVEFLYGSLRTRDGTPACALIRMFVTMPYEELEPNQQDVVRTVLGAAPEFQNMKCLTLLASAGELPAWNSRRDSVGHRALPLVSEESVARSPMIAQLIRQLGIEVGTFVGRDENLVVDVNQHTFNVFYVPEARGSAYIPAQDDFVIPYDVRSVLGFGGLLPSGELFATILFSKAPIARDTADLFKTLALNVKVAILPFVGRKAFA
ncbi:MAG: hypothetical protein WKF55_01545 [Gemmatimonadaceae bacterium]